MKIMKKTWTRNDIIEAISENVGLSLSDSSLMIEEIFEFILNELEKGDDVKISSFGTFSVRHKRSRIGRNPKTGVEVPITERNVVTFSSSNLLKSSFK
jgi:integration host factor subunit alpha